MAIIETALRELSRFGISEPSPTGRNSMSTIRIGRYRHYKGNEYSVIGVARHSETEEEFVVYRKEYDDHGLWVRPKDMFAEMVNVDGRMIPRFQYIGPRGQSGELSQ